MITFIIISCIAVIVGGIVGLIKLGTNDRKEKSNEPTNGGNNFFDQQSIETENLSIRTDQNGEEISFSGKDPATKEITININL